jgi:RimJ/RimL family protein N-acetyltransferase
MRRHFHHAHDAVARGLRLGSYDGYLFAGEGVEQRAFADVGPAEYGYESGFQRVDILLPWPYPPDGALTYIRDIAIPQMEREEAWHWTIRLAAEPNRIIGSISLIKGDTDNRGFWLGPQCHGRRLMSEACVWVNDFWFETLGFKVLRVSKAEGNDPSRRISQKQGMRLIGHGEKDYVSGHFPSEIWEITADEWRAWKARRNTARMSPTNP